MREQLERVGNATAALALLEEAARIAAVAHQRLLCTGVSGTHPAAAAAERMGIEGVKATTATRHVLKTLVRE